MKPSIPEVGIVIKLQEDVATVMLKGRESCKGCGQAKIGNCKTINNDIILKVKNSMGARVGDIVTIGVDKATIMKGYFLAFIIPLLALIIGALIGDIVGKYFLIPSLDVILGFIAFLFISFLSLRKLKLLDSSSSMIIKSVISDQIFTECIESDEIKRYSEYMI